MRPLHLQLQAFGPFSGTQALDFRELGDNPLFLISGSTGSGKTTILDAICFALYGDSSGETREPREMRSDHADPETLTEVTFAFTLGHRAYRVHRIPEQLRPKKTGEGLTTQKSDATLWERTGAADGDEGTVLASGWSKVTAAVQDLIGFSSQQFRQVIMLPQGKFRELLDSGSQQREAILEQLFPTELYGKIQDALADKARALKGEQKKLEERKANLLEHHELEDEEGLARRLQELRSEREGLESQLAAAEAERQQAQAALTQGRTLEGHFLEMEAAAAQFEALEARAPEMEAKKKRVKEAEAARGLSDLFQQLEKARREVREGEEKAKTRANALTDAQARFTEAGTRLKSEEGRKEEREALAREIARLEGIQEKVAPLAEARGELEACGDAVERARQAEAHAGEAFSKSEEAEARARETLEKEKEVAGKLGELEGKLRTMARLLHDRSALAKAQEEHAAALTSMAALETAKTAAVEAVRDALDREAAARSAWEKGQAAILAGTLEPETPCPVCGSTHHPSPAHSQEAIPTDEELDGLKAAVEDARKEESRVDRELTEVRGAAQALEKRTAELREQLGGDAELSAETLQAQHQELQAREAGARKAQEGLPQLRDAHKQAQRALEEARTALKNAEKARIDSEGELRAAETRVREREAEVPEGYRTKGRVAEELGEKKKALASAQAALEEAAKEEKAAALALRGAEESEKEAREALERAREEAATEEARWLERRTGAGFQTDEAYQEALLEPGQVEAIGEELRQYADDRVRVDRDLQKAKDLTRDKVRPNVPALEEAEAGARAQENQLRERFTDAGARLNAARGLKEELEEIDAEVRKLDEAYGVIGHLSDVANGRSMTFQRFVLAVYLDYVLRAASERLNRMTSGRYRLVRRTVQADKRSHSGLDLDVEDSYTGKARPVSTLSGGESFLSALSLAMGLAEIVQQFSGGVRLDTIFVDEGFGSLDPGALDQAVNALMELRENGRTVGVISHVPELKERIDVRLDVHGSRTGSWAEFVVL